MGYVWPSIWVTLKTDPRIGLLRLTQELGNTKNYTNIGLLRLTQKLGNTKTTQKHWKNNPNNYPRGSTQQNNPGFFLECA